MQILGNTAANNHFVASTIVFNIQKYLQLNTSFVLMFFVNNNSNLLIDSYSCDETKMLIL